MPFFLFSLVALTISILVGTAANFFTGLAVFVLLVGSCILQGIRQISADPLTNAMLTFLGTPTNEVIGPGWYFFFGYPYICGYIKVNAAKVPQPIQLEMPTPADGVTNEIPISVVWRFDPDNAASYLQSGKEEGVKELLRIIITERAREYINSRGEGPQNYKELREASEETINILLKSVLGDTLKRIPSRIPTSILLKFLREPKKEPTPTETKIWGKNWRNIPDDLGAIPPATANEVKTAVQHRREHIQNARQGRGNFQQPNLGILLLQLSLGDIEPAGEILKKLNEMEIATLELGVQTRTGANYREELEKLTKKPIFPRKPLTKQC